MTDKPFVRKCVICGEAVPDDNNAVLLDIQAGYLSNMALFLYGHRHLFPSAKCPGSPSRAQYFKDQPADTRTKEDGSLLFPIQSTVEVRYRDAMEVLREGKFWEED